MGVIHGHDAPASPGRLVRVPTGPERHARIAMLRSIRDRAERSYDLADAPEAVRYLEQGHTQGKVVATV